MQIPRYAKRLGSARWGQTRLIATCSRNAADFRDVRVNGAAVRGGVRKPVQEETAISAAEKIVTRLFPRCITCWGCEPAHSVAGAPSAFPRERLNASGQEAVNRAGLWTYAGWPDPESKSDQVCSWVCSIGELRKCHTAKLVRQLKCRTR